MDDLDRVFSRLLTPEMKARAEHDYLDYLQEISTNKSESLRALPPAPDDRNDLFPDITKAPALNVFGSANTYLKSIVEHSKPRFPPLENLPCANVQVEHYKSCPQPGKLACSECRLVSYCTKECQQAHWRIHKRDCKNVMRSNDWKPIWIRESRKPSFMVETVHEGYQLDEFSFSIALWGNTPAMDVINLSCNENDTTKDFSLAFIASGDLRHVIRTVNALPDNYSGKLDLLVNDRTSFIVCRNIVLLLILGTVSDEAMAVDIAFHFWYSVFMPIEYRLQISAILLPFLRQTMEGAYNIPLGPHSSISCVLPKKAKDYFLHFISDSLSMSSAQDEYDRVRMAPSRRDLRDRMYSGLKPSHRVAFQEYRRFGIVLPFGAMNAHFNCPNASLFSPCGKWFQQDYADPLEGWDLAVVIETGKAYGARPEDIYGCFYFFVSDQLRKFSRRLRLSKISFKLFSLDARDLPNAIHDGALVPYGVTASPQFDRIEVSNILDANYVGLRGVLVEWAPFLGKSRYATMVGYFMNWTTLQPSGRPTPESFRDLIDRFMKRFPNTKLMNFPKTHSGITNYRDLETLIILLADDVNALYDNSTPFSKYLKKQGLDDVLRKTELKMREIHSIVPHRYMAPLKGRPSALPEFPDDESFYYWAKMICPTWSERFIEFGHR